MSSPGLRCSEVSVTSVCAFRLSALYRRFLYTVWVIDTFYAFLFGYFGSLVPCWILLASVLAFLPAALFLERKAYLLTSKTLAILSGNLNIFLISLVLSREGIEYYYFPALMAPLVIFDSHRHRETALAVSFSLILWAITMKMGGGWASLPASSSEHLIALQVVNFVGAALLSVVFIFGFTRTMFSTQDILFESLQEKAENHRAVTESMNEGLVILDHTGKVIYHNPAALTILRLSSDQLMGQTSNASFWRAVHEDGASYLTEELPVNVALRSHQPVSGKIMGLRVVDKELRWITVNAIPLGRSSEQKVVCTFSDITELVEAQRENRFILDSLGIGLWKYDFITGKPQCDGALCNLFGLKKRPESIQLDAWLDRLTLDSRQAVERIFRELDSLKEVDVVLEIEGEPGQPRKFIGSRAVITHDPSGRPLKIHGVSWDHSKEMQAKRAFDEQSRLLDTVLEHLPSMVFVKDYSDQLRFKLLNRAGQILLGLRPEQVVGKNYFDLFPRDQAESFVAKDKEAFARKESLLLVETEAIQTPQGRRLLRTEKVPTFKPDGTPDLLIGISTDITNEVETEKALELERAKSIHSAKLASLGEMAAGIAHEINNPLGMITGGAAVLMRFRQDEAKFVSTCRAILKASERIAKIVKGLRKFSHSSDTSVHKIENLRDVITDALVITEAQARRAGVRMEVRVPPELSLFCDGAEIEQVIINLVNNAVYAVREATEKWVRIEACEDNKQVVLRIFDSGEGIPPHVEPKLFQPFFTTKPVGEGTGLGLSIVRGILQQHGASIALNRAIANSCFEIRFPDPNVHRQAA